MNQFNFHAIAGPNGMCECGVRADGTVVHCSDLLEAYVQERLSALRAVPQEPAQPLKIHEIAVGSRWRDLDSRMQRVVVVVGVQDGKVAYRNDPTGRLSYSRRMRFLRAFEPTEAGGAVPPPALGKR